MTKQYFVTGASFYKANNKGGQALAYGAVEYLTSKSENDCRIIIPLFKNHGIKEDNFKIGRTQVIQRYYNKYSYIISIFELYLYYCLRIPLRSQLAKDIQNSFALANISGGDSFSDIYGFKQWLLYARFSLYAIIVRKKLILLPQTIGPFKSSSVIKISKLIIKKASEVFIRDNKFEDTLKRWEVKYKLENDLSFYMKPEKVDMKIEKPSIGLNISSLAYDNNYPGLAGQFDTYKELVNEIISNFQNKGYNIYLIPHTYNVKQDGTFTQDLKCSVQAFDKLQNKTNVYIVNKEYNAPQLKFIISQMDLFIGTRMHSCFAAIFTNTPVFGLAYSYKFAGSFERYGRKGQYKEINNLKREEIPLFIKHMNINKIL